MGDNKSEKESISRTSKVFKIVLAEFGIEKLNFGTQTIISTSANTNEEVVALLAGLSALHIRVFKLTLMLTASFKMQEDTNDEFAVSKGYYNHVLTTMDKIYEEHVEMLLDKGIHTQKWSEGNEHS